MSNYNDIDLSRWRDYEHIWTDSLWIIDERDKTGGHSLDGFHGAFVPQIATQTFLRYTKEDDIVLDLFVGSGTAAIEAVRLNRRFIGVDINPAATEAVRAKIPADLLDDRIHIITGDSTSRAIVEQIRSVIQRMGKTHAQLLILHPPYGDIIKFSDDPRCLSNVEDFLSSFEDAASNGLELLEPGRFAVLVMGDKYTGGKLVPLGFLCMESMRWMGDIDLKAIVVKNITGNEIAKGRDGNLWRYRALAHGFYLFKHEYVMIFQKGRDDG